MYLICWAIDLCGNRREWDERAHVVWMCIHGFFGYLFWLIGQPVHYK